MTRWAKIVANAGVKGGTVYILASGYNGTLYIGVTSDLPGRMHEHRHELIPGFTSRYGVKHLVWYEHHTRIEDAIQREKTMKRWFRKWKLALISKQNPRWRDLYPNMLAEFGFQLEQNHAADREYSQERAARSSEE